MKYFLIGLLLLHTSGANLAAQMPPPASPSSKGLSLLYGSAHFAVRDRFLSQQKYSGGGQSLQIGWYELNEKRGFRLRLSLDRSASLRNFHISARLLRADLQLHYLYPIGAPLLFGRKLQLFLGPQAEISFYYRSQNIARGGAAVLDALSVAGLLSVGAGIEARLAFTDRLQLRGIARSSLLSLTGKLIDPTGDREEFAKVLTPFGALHWLSALDAEYLLLHRLSLWLGYRLDVLRISAWDELLSAGDTFFLTVQVRL